MDTVTVPLPGSRQGCRWPANDEGSKGEAQRHKIKLMTLLAAEAIEILKKAERAETNAILHVTC